MTSRTLKLGVAGLGFGAAVHAPALLKQTGVELIGIAGRSVTQAQAIADKLHINKGYGSIEELLACDLDAITLALPPDQVEGAVRTALRAGVAVICEKPLGINAQTANELAALAADHVTAMDFIFGELETFSRLKYLIDSKIYGMVREVKVEWLMESWAYRNHRWSWKTDAAKGGGVVSIFGSHIFYLAEWLLGRASSLTAEIDEPLAKRFAPFGEIAAENAVRFNMHFENNAQLSASIDSARPGAPIHRWIVHFDHATALLENTGTDYVAGFTLTVNNERTSELSSPEDGRILPFSRLAKRFLTGVREGKSVFPDLAAGARVQVIDAAIRTSAASSKVVPI